MHFGLFAAGTGIAVAALLAFEFRGLRAGVCLAKPLASAGFLGAALAAGALATPYGRAIGFGLALSALGDVLLLARGAERPFRLGLASFLLAHLVYAAAFLGRGMRPGVAAVAALAAVAAAALALRWLGPHVPSAMRVPVRAYVVVISAMLVCAAGAVASPRGPTILLGAGLFYVSDLAVARERFVASSFWNRAWGLPVYYAGQLLLAASVA